MLDNLSQLLTLKNLIFPVVVWTHVQFVYGLLNSYYHGIAICLHAKSISTDSDSSSLKMNVVVLLSIIAIFSPGSGAAVYAQHLVGHHISKRQTTVNNDVITLMQLIDCNAIIWKYWCGPSSDAQKRVDIALSCGNNSYACILVNGCTRNQNGDIYAVAALYFFHSIITDSESINGDSCSGAIASGLCPYACCSFLESESNRLGCCINTYINTTNNFLYVVYSEYRRRGFLSAPRN